jgi:hypothetical protein
MCGWSNVPDHLNSEELYFTFPPKSTKPTLVFSVEDISSLSHTLSTFSSSCTCFKPLLNYGSKFFNFVTKTGSFSVSNSFLVTGSSAFQGYSLFHSHNICLEDPHFQLYLYRLILRNLG